MIDTMMNIDCEDGSGPSGIELEGYHLSKGLMDKNPLLEVQNKNCNPVGICRETTSGLVCEPFVGMEFDTIEASHKFWELYARDAGFCPRIRSTSKKSNGVIRTRTYVCSKEGKRLEDQRPVCSKRRPETRCGCGFIMTVSLVKGKGVYRVVSFVREHNHELESKVNYHRLTDVECHLNNFTTTQAVHKPIVGMEFHTLEASQSFWEQYACDVGFGPRIRSTSRNEKNGVVRTRTYVCSKEGKKFEDLLDINSKRRLDRRCGCGVFMTVSLVKGKGTYRVVTFVEEHNHALDDKQRTPRLKVPRKSANKSQRRAIVENPIHNLTKAQGLGINHSPCEGEAQARETVVPNGAISAVLDGLPPNVLNGYRMGILCSEFMQLAYRAVGNDEVFEGVRRLIKEGHSLADKL